MKEMSVLGEMQTAPPGRGILSSRSFNRDVSVRLPPAESPAMVIFLGLKPCDSNHL